MVLRPIVKPARKSRYTLDELLSGMTSTMFRKKSIGVRGAAMRHGDVAAPDAGDIIWLDFLQPVANEQAGRRPALVLSPRIFNELNPITRGDRDWSFHVSIPDGHEITGVVQADQLRSASWEQRGSRFICKAPAGVLDEVRARLKPLLSL
ncbi:MAG: type II toxin-antitoxin system PemK/MazF family toxin [Pseudolabrys sp.]